MDLFDAIHDGRPERLAQLLLGHVLELRTEPRLRGLLGVPEQEDVQVDPERGADAENPSRGWRADLVARWPTGERKIELKLGASLTPAQRKALEQGEMHVLVVPSSRIEPTAEGRVTVVSWSQVAEATQNATVKDLLAQADRAFSWFCETLTGEDVRSEFDAYASGNPDACWNRLYRFLSTLDVRLREDHAYRASRAWSWSRRRNGGEYYGYWFSWGADPEDAPSAWIGFVRRDRGTVKLCMYKGNAPELPELPLEVEAAAASVIERLTQS